MFRKPFTVKRNVTLKSSDARKLLTRALGDAAGTESFAEYKKAPLSQSTLTLFNESTAFVYCSHKVPIFFECGSEQQLYPSIFFLWHSPLHIPPLFIHEPVFRYLENGADLMAPGIVSDLVPWEFSAGATVAVWIYSHGEARGPVAVGRALLESAEIRTGRAMGKAVAVLHWYRDALWAFGEKGEPPTRSAEELVKELASLHLEEEQEKESDEQKDYDEQIVEDEKQKEGIDEENKNDEGEQTEEKEEEQIEDEPAEELLLRCFLAALKYRVGKSTPLPLDVGQFYSQFLLPTVPEGRRLDIKKTAYKKFSVFLEEVNKREDGPLLRIKKTKKGNDSIEEIHWSHPLFRKFEPRDERLKDEEQTSKAKSVSIEQYFAVTDAVLAIFKRVAGDISKGALVSNSDTREFIREYVRLENLTLNKKVKLDPLLANTIKAYETEIDWNKLIQSVQSKMTPTFVIRTPDGRELVRKIKMPTIDFKIENRAGNKKVTLINNLTPFGIDIKTFCNQIKAGVATSATVTNEAVNCEGPQVLVQGNQIAFIGDLLKKDYSIDTKYTTGLNLAIKKKK